MRSVRTAAGAAISLAALSVSAQAGLKDLHVAVWGMDGSLLGDATVGFETVAGVEKGSLLPDGCYLVPNDAIKGALEIEAPGHGRVSFEVMLPNDPLVDVDIIYYGEGLADLVVDQPTKRIRGREGFNGGGQPNENCEDAILIQVDETIDGSTLGATIPELGLCGTAINSPGVWYRVQGTGTLMQATTCGDFFDYDTKISVFCGSCIEPLCIGGNDDNCPNGASGLLSTFEWCSQAQAEYLVLVHGFGGQSGSFQLRVNSTDVECDDAIACVPLGACCLPSGECADGLTLEECEAANGYYQGDGVTCEGGFSGYFVLEGFGSFIDISATGTPLNLGDDDWSDEMLGFDFQFLGNTIDQIAVCSNGYLTTGPDTTDFSNDPCPDPTEPNEAMFVLWDDWSPNVGGQVYVETLGVAPDRLFIAQWEDVPKFDQPDIRATFQCQLLEAGGVVAYCYGPLEGFPQAPGDVTVGIENEDGSEGWCVDDQAVEEGTCWTFIPQEQPPVYCPCRFLDFDFQDDFATPLVNGEAIDSPPDFGNLFDLNGFGAGNLGTAIFDSDDPGPNVGGPDPDLLVNMGNIVILQSADNPEQTVPGIYDVPNDAESGGWMEFEFLWPVQTRRLDMIDICVLDSTSQVILTDCFGSVRAYRIPGGWTTDVSVGGPGYRTLSLTTTDPQPGDNGTFATAGEFPDFDPLNVINMEIHLGNSGAIDNLEFCLSDEPDSAGGGPR